METLHTVAATRELLAKVRAERRAIALVPTMGNLHEGHISLVRHAKGIADCVVATIFVNPLQFGPTEDLDKYPRTFAQDQQKLIDEGVELLLAPPDEEIYPAGKEHHTQVRVPELSAILCGAARPGHFDGVTTVVSILFNIVAPDCAVFGQKDFQQLTIIRKMVRDLALPITIVGCPTVREKDGLAMSSRNNYLTADERAVAPLLHHTLELAASKVQAGNYGYERIEQESLATLSQAGFEPDYFAIRNSDTLDAPAAEDRDLVLLTAARIGATRLIDNQQVSLSGQD